MQRLENGWDDHMLPNQWALLRFPCVPMAPDHYLGSLVALMKVPYVLLLPPRNKPFPGHWPSRHGLSKHILSAKATLAHSGCVAYYPPPLGLFVEDVLVERARVRREARATK